MEKSPNNSRSGESVIIPSQEAEPKLADQMLQLHVAEYQALQARNNYWLAFQIALWPILVVSIAFLAEIHKDHPDSYRSFIIFSGVFVAQIIMVQYYKALFETYNNVKYIETQLRPMIRRIVGNNMFWRYEGFLKHNRGLKDLVWDYSPLLVSIIPLIVGIKLFLPGTPWDYIGLGVNLLFMLYGVAQMARASVKARNDFYVAVSNVEDN